MERALYTRDLARIRRARRDGFSRVYFGEDLCEALLPSPRELAEARVVSDGEGLGFTLVTPMGTDGMVHRVVELLDVLEGDSVANEVVANDYGTLKLLSERPGLVGIFGRILNKQARDPRVARGKGGDLGALSPPMLALLRSRGVRRVELDNTLPGAPGVAQEGLRVSLYTPYAVLTLTRMCAFNRADPAGTGHTVELVGRCRRHCLDAGRYTLRHAGLDVPLLLRGNALLYRVDTLPVDLGALGIDRLIVQDLG